MVHSADSILLHLSKDFDKVDIGVLTHRWTSMNIKGRVGRWLHNFLTDRTQRVLANCTLSSYSNITSGVPQGTVLGPILFLIYIQSLNEIGLNSILTSFADDSKILHPIKDIDDIISMQDDLLKLNLWESESNMVFNQ